MNEQAIFEEVRRIIVEVKSEVSPVDPNSIKPESELASNLMMDSIDFVRMIIGIEEAFHIIAQDNDFLAATMQTVGDVVQVVSERLKSPEG